jgi:hypothetical protein
VLVAGVVTRAHCCVVRDGCCDGVSDAKQASVSIIQPVLQWGSSAAGGGPYWAIASWFVGGAHTVYSELKIVNAGDTILGNMTLDASSQKVLPHHWVNVDLII